MENKRLEDKVDKIQDDISDIKVILARNTESLEVHIKRTNLLEEKLAPVEEHVAMVKGAVKLIGIIATVLAIVEVASRLK